MQGPLPRLRHQDRRLPASPDLSLRRPGGVPMSHDLARRSSGGLVRGRRVSRPVAHQIETARADGLVTAAQIEAAAYATQTALRLSAQLTTEEMLVGALAPRGEGRYRVLVDQFTAVAAGRIAEMGR